MPYTEIDSSNITVRGKCACDEDMVVFDYDGISYVYYTSLVDAYWGMVEEHEITLNPYLRDEGEMYRPVSLAIGIPKKTPRSSRDKWLNQDRHQVAKNRRFT